MIRQGDADVEEKSDEGTDEDAQDYEKELEEQNHKYVMWAQCTQYFN